MANILRRTISTMGKRGTMSTTSLGDTLGPSDYELLEAQVRECFGRVAYSHKTQEKCADAALSRLAWVKRLQIGLSAITTGGLVTVIAGSATTSTPAAWIGAVTSTILLVLNTYTKESNPGQAAERHKEAAARLWDIRESYLSLLTDLMGRTVPSDVIRKRRDELQKVLAGVYASAPRTDAKGFKRAQTALKRDEELTFSEAEIDAMLPPALRKVSAASLTGQLDNATPKPALGPRP
jgi:hypothetical protein